MRNFVDKKNCANSWKEPQHWGQGTDGDPKSPFWKYSQGRGMADVCDFQLILGAKSPAREKTVALSCWLLNWVTVPVRVGGTFSSKLGLPQKTNKKKEEQQKKKNKNVSMNRQGATLPKLDAS